uniref:Uncharacterized protein n=1 Tax=Anguilla anguilla TaxID=7936 RepID=A0A0E9PSX2_ANGAN
MVFFPSSHPGANFQIKGIMNSTQ